MDGPLSRGLIKAYKIREETRRKGIGGVQSVKTQAAGVQRRERRRMKGREIHAKEIVRLSRIGRLKVKLRCFRET